MVSVAQEAAAGASGDAWSGNRAAELLDAVGSSAAGAAAEGTPCTGLAAADALQHATAASGSHGVASVADAGEPGGAGEAVGSAAAEDKMMKSQRRWRER
jgi:hypothetical protein